MKDNMKDNGVLQDWLEFEENDGCNEERLTYVNIKSSEISEVSDMAFSYPVYMNGSWTKITMKNGNEHNVNMPYKKVVKLIK